MLKNFIDECPVDIKTSQAGFQFLKYLGPGLLITVGFIDPGNWAANLAAGAEYGYTLLWMVTLSTFMLIVLQHSSAQLGIVTGECLAEGIKRHLPRPLSTPVLISAVGASAVTSMAELLGGAIALNMIFGLPVKIGASMLALMIAALLISNSYSKLEKLIVAFVSLIGLAFLYELSLVNCDWQSASAGWVRPAFPEGSMLVIMSVLGAVVMPHNLFLHSEIIQSRQWNLKDQETIKKQLRFELFDTMLAMLIGWGINSAMIILAAATFWAAGTAVTQLEQAKDLLQPLLGNGAGFIFALALLFAGFSSSITAGMSGGIISAGMAGEAYNVRDKHSLSGVAASLGLGLLGIWLIEDSFKGLLFSQMVLSVQLPVTMAALVYLTSSTKVMGSHANKLGKKMLLLLLTLIVTVLNVMLFVSAI